MSSKYASVFPPSDSDEVFQWEIGVREGEAVVFRINGRAVPMNVYNQRMRADCLIRAERLEREAAKLREQAETYA